MKNIIFSACFLMAMPAMAGIIDPGDLAIGGQGVFGSTITALGKDTTGYSINASSGISLGGCITFGDSTQQCSAGGGGNAVLSATQSFNGANSFVSTLTARFGYSYMDGWPVAYHAAVASGSYASNVKVSTLSLPGAGTYEVAFAFKLDGAASADRLILRFVDPPGSGFRRVQRWTDSVGESGVLYGNSATNCYLAAVNTASRDILPGEVIVGHILIAINSVDLTKAHVSFRSSYPQGSNVDMVDGGCFYDGAANIDYFTLRMEDNGSFTGDVRVIKLN